jgi:hypothetical protein
VVAADHRDHRIAPGREARRAESVLDGLGARVGEEDAVHPARQDGQHVLDQAQLRVGVVARLLRVRDLPRLLAHRRHHVWVAVAGRDHADAGGDVEVRLALARPDG